MKADKYLQDIGLENIVGEEFFNQEDESYYTVEELMESYHKHRMDEYKKYGNIIDRIKCLEGFLEYKPEALSYETKILVEEELSTLKWVMNPAKNPRRVLFPKKTNEERGRPFFISDPDMPMTDEEKKSILKAWKACKPKLTNTPGIVMIYGTGGTVESGIDFNKFYDDAKKEWRSTKGLPKKK